MYENVNSLPNRFGGNRKLDKMKALIQEWGADVVGMVEHRQNLKHNQNGNGWNKLFRRGDEDVRSVVAHNVHENISPVQEGGVGLVAFGPLIGEPGHDTVRKRCIGLRQMDDDDATRGQHQDKDNLWL